MTSPVQKLQCTSAQHPTQVNSSTCVEKVLSVTYAGKVKRNVTVTDSSNVVLRLLINSNDLGNSAKVL